jgi:hypothetical protein
VRGRSPSACRCSFRGRHPGGPGGLRGGPAQGGGGSPLRPPRRPTVSSAAGPAVGAFLGVKPPALQTSTLPARRPASRSHSSRRPCPRAAAAAKGAASPGRRPGGNAASTTRPGFGTPGPGVPAAPTPAGTGTWPESSRRSGLWNQQIKSGFAAGQRHLHHPAGRP